MKRLSIFNNQFLFEFLFPFSKYIVIINNMFINKITRLTKITRFNRFNNYIPNKCSYHMILRQEDHKSHIMWLHYGLVTFVVGGVALYYHYQRRIGSSNAYAKSIEK